MQAILRTNDPVLISCVRSLLMDVGIGSVEFRQPHCHHGWERRRYPLQTPGARCQSRPGTRGSCRCETRMVNHADHHDSGTVRCYQQKRCTTCGFT